MVYTIRTFHFKKRKKLILFKQYFNVFKFQNYLLLFSDGLNGSSASPIAPRNEKKGKNFHEKFISPFFFDLWWVSASRINGNHAIATLLSHAFGLFFLECYTKFNSIVT